MKARMNESAHDPKQQKPSLMDVALCSDLFANISSTSLKPPVGRRRDAYVREVKCFAKSCPARGVGAGCLSDSEASALSLIPGSYSQMPSAHPPKRSLQPPAS